MRRSTVVFLGLAVGALPGFVPSDSLLADVRDDNHKGRPLTASEWTKLCDAIACIQKVNPATAAGINKLKGPSPRKSRICGTSAGTGTYGSAWTDDELNDHCKDVIHLSPELFASCRKWLIAATLVHEFEHVRTTRNGGKIPGENGGSGHAARDQKMREQPAYDAELAFLNAAKSLPGLSSDDVAAIDFKIAESTAALSCYCFASDKEEAGDPDVRLKHQIWKARKRAEVTALSDAMLSYRTIPDPGNANGIALEATKWTINGHTTSVLPLNLSASYDVVLMPEAAPSVGRFAIAVSGAVGQGNSGRVVIVEVESNTHLAVKNSLTVPHCVPARMGFDGVTGSLYVLDPVADEVLVIRDTTGDRCPDAVQSTAFATAGSSPAVASAMSLRVGRPGGAGSEVSVSLIDSFDDESTMAMDEVRTFLYDDTGDGVADRSELLAYKETAWVPVSFSGHPRHGDVQLEVYGAWMSVVDVRALPSNELLGSAVVALTNPTLNVTQRASVTLSRPLVQGEEISVVDRHNDVPEMDPWSVVVQP